MAFAMSVFAAPTANAGTDLTVFVGEAVRLDGTTSTGYTTASQADGTWSILWQTGDGFDAENVIKCPHVYTTAGVYTATLTVKDSSGASSSASIQITAQDIPAADQGNIRSLTDTGNSATNTINLQTAINAAAANPFTSEIRVPAGFVFNDPLILPARTSTNYITIRVADLTNLPQNVRVTAADKAKLFRMNMRGAGSSGSNNGVEMSYGAQYYRIIGLEIRKTVSETNTDMIGSMFVSNSVNQNHVIFDRVLLDGNGFETRKGAVLNGEALSLLNSSILNIKARGVETKAVANWKGGGPIAVINNRLEAAAINSLIGGSPVSGVNEVLDGYVFRGNYVWKNPAWLGQGYGIKNLWELKHGFNTVAVGNIMENSYSEGQSGEAILIKSQTDEGCAYCEVRNVDFRNNKILNVRAGFNVINLQAFNAPYPAYANHIRFVNNFWQQTSGRGNLSQGADYFEIIHNTFTTIDSNDAPVSGFIEYRAGSSGVPENYKAPGYKLLNNLVYDAVYGIALRSDTGDGINVLNNYLANDWEVRKNVFGALRVDNRPANNYYPATIKSDFVDYAGGNFSLKPNSPYKHAATDGKDIGADMTTLNSSIASATNGNWSSTTTTVNTTTTIKGKMTKNGNPVSGVVVTLSGSSSATTMTDAEGNYSFVVAAGGTYTVTPTKRGDVSGINSLDGTRIQQHVIKLTNLSPIQMIAADVNNNGVVNSVDAARIQEVMVGIPSASIIGEWKFLPAVRQYNSVMSGVTEENYEAILVGDVSSSSSSAFNQHSEAQELQSTEKADGTDKIDFEQNFSNSFSNSEITRPFITEQQKESLTGMPEIGVSLPNATAYSGTSVEIPITVEDLAGQNIEAFDFSVFYNPGILQPATSIVTTAGTLSQNCTALANSPADSAQILVSVTCPNPSINSGSGTLIKLRFNIIGAGGQQSQLSFIDPAQNQSMFYFNDVTPLAKTTNGALTVVGPTAAPVTASGRVTTSNGRGISRARVSLTGLDGATHFAITNTFGYYRFAELTAGETYVLSVSAKRLKFTPQTQARVIVEDTYDINFTSY